MTTTTNTMMTTTTTTTIDRSTTIDDDRHGADVDDDTMRRRRQINKVHTPQILYKMIVAAFQENQIHMRDVKMDGRSSALALVALQRKRLTDGGWVEMLSPPQRLYLRQYQSLDANPNALFHLNDNPLKRYAPALSRRRRRRGGGGGGGRSRMTTTKTTTTTTTTRSRFIDSGIDGAWLARVRRRRRRRRPVDGCAIDRSSLR